MDPERPVARHARLAPMKSWPGLLQVLRGLQLLFGGTVFACVCAYVQRDAAWVAGELPAWGGGYRAPLTPFVLVVASVAWLLSAILLGLSATSYYRSVLLEAPWWPPTEAALNALLFLLYVAAAGAYVDVVTLGGLCSSPLAGGPLLSALCRLAGGQAAALVFLFLTALLYLASSVVCIRMWRHEAVQQHRGTCAVLPASPGARARHVVFEDETGPLGGENGASARGEKLEAPRCSTSPARAVPDYVLKYPAIRSAWQREQYKGVFCDRHAEYRELRGQLRATLRALRELDTAMSRLPWREPSREEQHGAAHVWRDYTRVKRAQNLALLEKQERCDYLRKKLLHIKSQIREYDHAAAEGSVCF